MGKEGGRKERKIDKSECMNREAQWVTEVIVQTFVESLGQTQVYLYEGG